MYYKTPKQHKTVLYRVFEDRNDVRSLRLSQRILTLWPYGEYSLFQFEGSDVISVLKNSIEYNFVFFKCLLFNNLISYMYMYINIFKISVPLEYFQT